MIPGKLMSEIASSELVVNQPWLSHVIRRVQSLRFGSIHIIEARAIG
jgi:hypothetical protein